LCQSNWLRLSMPILGYLLLAISLSHSAGGGGGGDGVRHPQQQRVDAAIALQQTIQPLIHGVALALRVKRQIEGVHLRRHEVALRPRAVRIALVAVAHGLVHLRAPHLQLLQPLLPRAAVALRVRTCQLFEASQEII